MKKETTLLALVLVVAGCAQTDAGGRADGSGQVSSEKTPIRYHVVLRDGEAEVGVALRDGLPATVELAMCAAHPANGADLRRLPPLRGVAVTGIGGHTLETTVAGRAIRIRRRGEGVLARFRVPLGSASPLDSFGDRHGAALALATLLPLAVGVDRAAELTVADVRGETPRMTSTLAATADGRGFRAASARALAAAHVQVGAVDEYRLEVEGRVFYVVVSGDATTAAASGLAHACGRLAKELAGMAGHGLPDRYRLFVDCGRRAATEGAVGSPSFGRVQARAALGTAADTQVAALAATAMAQSILGPPAELAESDLTAPVTSAEFWISDGVSYYLSALACLRAGVVTEDEFLAEMSALLNEADGHVRVAGTSVLDTARRLRPPMLAGPALVRPASTVRGAVAAFLLDAEMRAMSDGAAGFEDGLRRAVAAEGLPISSRELLLGCSSAVANELGSAESFVRGSGRPNPTDLAGTGLAAEGAEEIESPAAGRVLTDHDRPIRWRLVPGRTLPRVRRALLYGARPR